MDLKNLTDNQLFETYPNLLKELKSRNLIRTNNLVGEMAEHVVVSHYNNTPGLINLTKTAPSTRNVDAIGNNGKRYAIKSTSGSSTGKFDSIPKEGSDALFDHLIILIWNDNYEAQNIYELTWDQFLKYRRWKKPENKWYVPIPIKIRGEFIKIL